MAERENIRSRLKKHQLTQVWLINQLGLRGIVTDKTEMSSVLAGTRSGSKADAIIELSHDILDKYEDKKDKECVDYKIIKQYASLPVKASIELKNSIKPILDTLQPKARHVIILHDSADHKMICEVFLCFMDFMSFTICVSEDAIKYLGDKGVRICVVLEDEQLIDM